MLGHTRGDRAALSPKGLAAAVMVGLFVLFVIQNSADVDIRFLFWKLTVSRVFLLLGCLALGVLVGLLIGRDFIGRTKP